MKEYLILKMEGGDLRNATVAAVVQSEDEPEDVLPQGFLGEGRYAVLNWTERVEGDLTLGPVAVTAVEDKAAREKRRKDEVKVQEERAQEAEQPVEDAAVDAGEPQEVDAA